VFRSGFYVVVAALLWGTTGTAAFFLGTEVPPLAIGAATMGFGGVILAFLGGRACLAVVSDRGARVWLGFGVLGVVVYPLTFYWGMSLAGIALGNLVALGLGPIAVALLEWAVDKSAATRRWRIALVFAITGVIVMSSGKVELGGDRVGNVALGLGLAVAAGLSYGLYTYAFGRLIDRGHTPRAVVGAVFGSGAPVLLVVVALVGGGLFASPGKVSLVAYLVLGPMVVAYLAFSKALQTLRSSSVASIALLEPVAAGALAFVVVGERLGPLAGLGALLVLVSLALVSSEKSDRPGR
jgi:drug/metabolite transporter, DME family